MKSYFSSFINLYSLSKTLRFELKPTEATKKLLKDKNVVAVDTEIAQLYRSEMKPILDDLHRRFIEEALSQEIFGKTQLQDYFKLVSNYKIYVLQKEKSDEGEKKFKEEIEIVLKDMRRVLVSAFYKVGEKWRKKYSAKGIKIGDKIKGHNVITEKHTLDILLLEYPEKQEIIEKFKGFWTYFNGYNKNRSNYYSEEAKATSVAYRTVNENLSRFIDNYIAFHQVAAVIPELEGYKEALSTDSFNSYLNQNGIDIYNRLIGGYEDEKGKKVQGINEKINQYCQQKKVKLPKLKVLYKQIASDKKSFEIFIIKDGEEWQNLRKLFAIQRKLYEVNGEKVILFEGLKDMYRRFFYELKNLSTASTFDLEKIYLNKTSINTLSNNWFINWQTFANLLRIKFDKKTGEQEIPPQINLFKIKSKLESIKSVDGTFEEIFKISDKDGRDRKKYFENNAWITFITIWEHEIADGFAKLEELEAKYQSMSSKEFRKNNKDHIAYIKNVCDAFLAMQRMAKYFLPKDENLPRDEDLYWIIDLMFNDQELSLYYNAFRNHLSKKPYNQEKIKLNFENGILLEGWSDGQEMNKCGVILRNDEKYYLGILLNRGLFRTDKPNNEMYKADNFTWERLILTNLKFQTIAGKGFLGKYGISYGNMDPSKSTSLLQEFIKENYLSRYSQLQKVVTDRFNSKKEFDAEIKGALKDCFSMKFIAISETYLTYAIDRGDMYLFEIASKDSSKFSKGKENIHTTYWKELFSKINFQAPILALNGGAEVFYRKGQKEKLSKKLDKQGKEVIDAKRYAADKLFFHVPITINYGKPKYVKYKEIISHFLKKNEVNVIGIDRGEKHLLYYSVVSPKGEILEQGSLNKIRMGDKEVDFNEILTKRAAGMKRARQNWEQIGTIKNLKEGYLSQAVHEIYRLIIKYNAVIVLEDLNTEFKAKRTAKVEKSVYKKFELALARKLNHLILKDKHPDEPGGVLNAYQLTPAIEPGKISQFERAKQWGIMFYVRPHYTSTTDPVTGWRKHFYVSHADTVDKIKKFFNPQNKEVGIRIFYSEKHKCWGFLYAQKETERTWELLATTEQQRFRYDRESKKNIKINLYDEFEKLFTNIDGREDVYSQLVKSNNFNWKTLAYLWTLLNQIRSTDRDAEGNENDFIQSPVYSERINAFYDSRKHKNYKLTLPENGDANGAYNIARKGLILRKKIKENPKSYDLYIKDIDWDIFLAGINN